MNDRQLIQATYQPFFWWRRFAGQPDQQAIYKQARGVTIISLDRDLFGQYHISRKRQAISAAYGTP